MGRTLEKTILIKISLNMQAIKNGNLFFQKVIESICEDYNANWGTGTSVSWCSYTWKE
jgi:hypothetical protein